MKEFRIKSSELRIKCKKILHSALCTLHSFRGFTLISLLLRCKRSCQGFTLIELMVAISIIAILSTIGMVSYGAVQKQARDVKRKEDLRSIAIALELYYNDHKRYPCTTDWQTSSTTPSFWIRDTCTPRIDFDNKYIKEMPRDPLKNTGNVPKSDDQYGYGYFSRGDGGSCDPNPGRQFALITQLENPNDSDSLGKKDVKWCDGKYLRAGYGYGSRTFAITSW